MPLTSDQRYLTDVHVNFIRFITETGEWGRGLHPLVYKLSPSSIQAVTKTINIKAVVNPKVQSNLCTLQLTVSPVVGNKATKTASAVTTVWKQCKQIDHPSLPSRAQHHLPVPLPFHAVPELCLTIFLIFLSDV